MFYEPYFDAHAGPKYVNPANQFESYFLHFDSGARLELMSRPDILTTQHDLIVQFTSHGHLAVAVDLEAEVAALTA